MRLGGWLGTFDKILEVITSVLLQLHIRIWIYDDPFVEVSRILKVKRCLILSNTENPHIRVWILSIWWPEKVTVSRIKVKMWKRGKHENYKLVPTYDRWMQNPDTMVQISNREAQGWTFNIRNPTPNSVQDSRWM